MLSESMYLWWSIVVSQYRMWQDTSIVRHSQSRVKFWIESHRSLILFTSNLGLKGKIGSVDLPFSIFLSNLNKIFSWTIMCGTSQSLCRYKSNQLFRVWRCAMSSIYTFYINKQKADTRFIGTILILLFPPRQKNQLFIQIFIEHLQITLSAYPGLLIFSLDWALD